MSPPRPAATAVVWFRRDLRLADHPALTQACQRFDRVVPLFVWDPALLRRAGPARLAFLAGCLDRLGAALGGNLVTRRGTPAVEVAAVARECAASAVLVSADYGPYGAARDRDVAASLRADGRVLTAVGSPYAVDPGELLASTGEPYAVFGAFARAWRSRPCPAPLPAPSQRRITSAGLAPGAQVRVGGLAFPEPGEEAAHRHLERFLRAGLDGYRDQRDRVDLDATSRLSPYLRLGCLHPRQLLAELSMGDPSHERFATELCWRDFFADVLHHRPDGAYRGIRPGWERMEVDEGPLAEERFRAWTQGETGFPFVDAGMRQLRGEGWMHNRARLVVASFLVKDLHIAWTRGARWFMEQLLDGDLASNQLNWQWVAGSGTDAAPYFRVFNPVSQARRFDPHGDYVRRWVPELARLPQERVHEPWCADLPGYPARIVDHARERREALARYATMRQGGRGRPHR